MRGMNSYAKNAIQCKYPKVRFNRNHTREKSEEKEKSNAGQAIYIGVATRYLPSR